MAVNAYLLLSATFTATLFVTLCLVIFVNAVLGVSRETDVVWLRRLALIAGLMFMLTIWQVLWLTGAFVWTP